MKYTKTVTVKEFPEITEALLSMQEDSYEAREPLLTLLLMQTAPKQIKFWKYYDEHTTFCQYDYCNLRNWKYLMEHNYCSQEHRIKQIELEAHLLIMKIKDEVK